MKIVNFVGYSGSGKTTLIEKLVEIFSASGLRVAVIKDAHHGFDMDRPGKDSFRFREAGASQVIVRSDSRWAMLSEIRSPKEKPDLKELLGYLKGTDLVLIEGFKSDPASPVRLEVWRRQGKMEDPICLQDSGIEAVITKTEDFKFAGHEVLDIDSPESIAKWIADKIGLILNL